MTPKTAAAIALSLLFGCGAEAPELGCAPGITCKRAIDVVEDGTDCVPSRDRANSSGMCGEASLACDASYVDLDADPTSGCETLLADVESDWVAVPDGESLGTITVNTTTADLAVSVELVALDSDDPDCPPVTFEQSVSGQGGSFLPPPRALDRLVSNGSLPDNRRMTWAHV